MGVVAVIGLAGLVVAVVGLGVRVLWLFVEGCGVVERRPWEE